MKGPGRWYAHWLGEMLLDGVHLVPPAGATALERRGGDGVSWARCVAGKIGERGRCRQKDMAENRHCYTEESEERWV